jgi:hypothetical protein
MEGILKKILPQWWGSAAQNFKVKSDNLIFGSLQDLAIM